MKCIALMDIKPEQPLSRNAMGEGHAKILKDGTEAIKTPLRRFACPMVSIRLFAEILLFGPRRVFQAGFRGLRRGGRFVLLAFS